VFKIEPTGRKKGEREEEEFTRFGFGGRNGGATHWDKKRLLPAGREHRMPSRK